MAILNTNNSNENILDTLHYCFVSPVTNFDCSRKCLLRKMSKRHFTQKSWAEKFR